MKDKERILMYLIRMFFPTLGRCAYEFNRDVFLTENIKVGDLVLCSTSGCHRHTVGYVVEIENLCAMTLREVGGTKLCKVYNESFYKIFVDKLCKFELLEGNQRKVYEMVCKLLKDSWLRLKDILFTDNFCTVSLRESFKNELYVSFDFMYDEEIKKGIILESLEKALAEKGDK